MREATIATTGVDPNDVIILKIVSWKSCATWWCIRCRCGGGAGGAGSGGGSGGVDGGADSADGGADGGGWIRIRPGWFCDEVIILDQLVKNVKWS